MTLLGYIQVTAFFVAITIVLFLTATVVEGGRPSRLSRILDAATETALNYAIFWPAIWFAAQYILGSGK